MAFYPVLAVFSEEAVFQGTHFDMIDDVDDELHRLLQWPSYDLGDQIFAV